MEYSLPDTISKPVSISESMLDKLCGFDQLSNKLGFEIEYLSLDLEEDPKFKALPLTSKSNFRSPPPFSKIKLLLLRFISPPSVEIS